jgi:hypothetical protein
MKNLLFILGLLCLGITCTKDKIPVTKIEFNPPDIIEITVSSASFNVSISSSSAAVIIERGVCWDTVAVPTIAKNRTINGSGTGSFTAQLTGLKAGTNYYMRAYGKSSTDVIYGDEITFKTLALPSVITLPVTDISFSGAILNGEITSDGDLPILEKGFCWDTIANPDTSKYKIKLLALTVGKYLTFVNHLLSDKMYHVKAFVVTEAGIVYGNEETFVTLVPPLINTTPVSLVTETSAIAGGNVISEGSTPVRSRGVCWGTSPVFIPGVDQLIDPGIGTGSFNLNITGLNPNTSYYVRAFAQVSFGTVYGEILTFKTLPAPSITTTRILSITPFSATSGGTITSNGGGAILQRGVCWNIKTLPTINNFKTIDGAGTGSYKSYLSKLDALTGYYVRAYAVTAGGTFYGDEQSFETEPGMPGTPILLLPVNDAVVGCCSVNFSWNKSVFSDFYEIQVSTSGNFTGTISYTINCSGDLPQNSGVNSNWLKGTSQCMGVDSTTQNGQWYWRVKGRNSTTGIDGMWSETRSFVFKN